MDSSLLRLQVNDSAIFSWMDWKGRSGRGLAFELTVRLIALHVWVAGGDRLASPPGYVPGSRAVAAFLAKAPQPAFTIDLTGKIAW